MKLPKKCPACGAKTLTHAEKTERMHEWIRYSCGGEIVLQGQNLVENASCGDALAKAIKKLNAR